MKKVNIVKLAIMLIVALASCKSSESAYKKAYETAKQKETANTTEETTVVPAPSTTSSNVRREKVKVISGDVATLKAYGIVCGSFSLKTNADALKSYLQSEGYSKATVVFNTDIVMYRVIIDSYDAKESAISARNAFRAKYSYREDFQSAWILERL
ncbi:hypothetical protein EZS27_039621 [termite gut metagenome]|uniref:SPOR domain-containing protein n=1 Tax=termite gut metagenome TaxID=433724 RepID=A0A5J4PJN7_9ZZZZ